jgi:putative NIF3 family GTP cyclohydrolase 1 type 2
MPLDELVAIGGKGGRGAGEDCPWRAGEVASAGVVTGGAGAEIHKAAQEGVDTFVTGEGPHWAAVAAEELGVNLLLAGHYATETFGVKALAAHVGRSSACRGSSSIIPPAL